MFPSLIFGCFFSYFSPLLKSITKRDEVDYVMIGEDPDKRENFISMLESRFLYLAADARSTLRLFYALEKIIIREHLVRKLIVTAGKHHLFITLEINLSFCLIDARGWRPSYRNVLLEVRKRLKIPCSAKLSTEDLEVEIFLHLLQDYSRYVKLLSSFCFKF